MTFCLTGSLGVARLGVARVLRYSIMQTVYIETTIPSYLTARPSSNFQRQRHQKQTRSWWETERQKYQIFVSTYVLDEVALGDSDAAARRLTCLEDIPVLEILPETDLLAEEIIRVLRLPPKAITDASHLALAILHNLDYILTWNCTHIANPHLQRHLIEFCNANQLHTPVICTPEHFTGTYYE